MPIDSHLIHRCTISKVSPGPADPLGGPGNEILTAMYKGSCRLVEKTERLTAEAGAEPYFVTRYVLLLPAWASIREGYRVHSLVDERGNSFSGTFTIRAIKSRRTSLLHHHSIELEKV